MEGLAAPDGTLSPLQAAFLDRGSVQCGFCIPGQLMSAQALLHEHPHPTRAEIEEGMAGNLCRCACCEQIFDAIEQAAEGEVLEVSTAAVVDAGGAKAGATAPAEGLDQ
ncbi:MAG: 2Fe-2S iron-sulfur cluster-binding protein [Chloroflexota bacterium]